MYICVTIAAAPVTVSEACSGHAPMIHIDISSRSNKTLDSAIAAGAGQPFCLAHLFDFICGVCFSRRTREPARWSPSNSFTQSFHSTKRSHKHNPAGMNCTKIGNNCQFIVRVAFTHIEI